MDFDLSFTTDTEQKVRLIFNEYFTGENGAPIIEFTVENGQGLKGIKLVLSTDDFDKLTKLTNRANCLINEVCSD